MAYVPAAWASFGGALAAVAGALTGLLFVALSVKATALATSRALSSRAAQTLVLFMTSVMIAVLARHLLSCWQGGQSSLLSPSNHQQAVDVLTANAAAYPREDDP